MEIELRRYTKRIRKKIILEDINLSLHSNRIYGLSGINGCGKTMLLRALCGLIQPDSGEVLIDGKRVNRNSSFSVRTGILIENPSFLPNRTGMDNLKLLASIRNVTDETDLHNTLSKTGLDPEDKRTYRKYSLGMKQKLGIAAAFIEHPQMILLDEPFNALDEESVIRVRNMILDARDNGALIVVASHDTDILNDLTDVMIFMTEGRVASVKENCNA